MRMSWSWLAGVRAGGATAQGPRQATADDAPTGGSEGQVRWRRR